MTMTRPTTEQITHETRLLSDVLSGIVTPEAFGAVGDGVTDDTAALQNALDTLKEVRGSPGKTYLVRRVSGTRRCLLWKSGMRWFGCGSVIKLADGEYVKTVGCSVIMSEGTDQSPSTVTTNTSFIGTVDGNEQNQDAIDAPSGLQFTPTMYMNRVASSHFDFTIINGLWYCFYCSGLPSQVYDNRMTAKVLGSRGGAVWISGTRWSIDSVFSKDIQFTVNQNAEGSPFVPSISDSTIGRIYAENYGRGIKFQNGCVNVSVDSIVAVYGAGTSGINEAAVKFQGIVPSSYNTNINVGSITCTGFGRHGLYCYGNERLTIGSYIGEGNGHDTSQTATNRTDVYILYSNDVTINSIQITNCKSYPISIQPEVNNVNIGHATFVDTPDGVSLLQLDPGSVGDASNITIQSIAIRNEAAGWSASVIAPTVNETNIAIGPISIDVPFTNYTSAGRKIIVEGGVNGQIRTGPVMFRGSPTSQVVQLTNNSTTTAVPSAAVMVSSNGIDMAPIIKVEPVSYNGNSNSGGLMAGRFTASAGNQSTGGLTIRHPAIGSTGAFYARWTLEGYQAPGDCLEATNATSLIVMGSATAAQIADKTHSINLGSKHAGQLVWDTTNNRLLRSSGTTDVSPWHVVDGSATVTPS